jgi:alpha 1,2-mannosyltransferase
MIGFFRWSTIILGVCQIIIFNAFISSTVKDDAEDAMLRPMRSELTTSRRRSNNTDVIVYLAQFSANHSSYGTQYDEFNNTITGISKLEKSLRLLYSNYLDQFPFCDVIIFYEPGAPPDLITMAKLKEIHPQLMFRELTKKWWSLPFGLKAKNHRKWRLKGFSIGYRHMCRWFGILIWEYLSIEGYSHVMRMDDDSYLHSKIDYNLFDYMREHGKKYAFRQAAAEDAVGHGYDSIIDGFLTQHPDATTPDLIDSFNVDRHIGFYNNWFIADIGFFTTPPASTLLSAIDESKLIYTQRTGDLVIHSTVVRLLLHPEQIHWFRDFTYEHMTLCRRDKCNGCPSNGGISRGLKIAPDEWFDFATNVQKRYKDNPRCIVSIGEDFIGADDSVRSCSSLDSRCGFYLEQLIGSVTE